MTENITLVAEWNEVAVSFNTVGGAPIATEIIEKGEKYRHQLHLQKLTLSLKSGC